MLIAILQELNNTSPEIEASCIVSINGITIAAVLPNASNEDRAGAMCAGMLHFAEKTSREFARGSFENALIKGNNGYVLLFNAGQEALLAISAKPGIELDRVILDVDRAIEKIRFGSFAGLRAQ